MLQGPLLNIEVAAAQGAGASGAPEAPSSITIWPGRGEVRTQDGRGPWKLDAAESVIVASLKAVAGNVLPVDIDHGVHVPGHGRTGRAVGWISALKVDAASGAVQADVEWTDEGRQLVTSRAYRFVSPTFASDKAGRVRAFLGVALVNSPAITELPKVASAIQGAGANPKSPLSAQENAMTEEELAKLRTALGLDEKAEGTAIVTAAEKVSAAHAVLVTAARKVAVAAGQDELTVETATGIAAKLKASDADPDPAKYVPIGTFEELKVEVAGLKQANADDAATTVVEDAIKGGKVIPAQKDWAMNYARQDLAGFRDYLAKTPVILSGGRTGVAADLPKGSEGLTELELQTCKSMGLTVEQFKQAKED